MKLSSLRRLRRRNRAFVQQPDPGPSALDMGLQTCLNCLHVSPTPHRRCPHCNAKLHLRKPNSITRCWVYTLTAIILYFPANLLPIMHTRSLVGQSSDTIMSGIILFWQTGSYGIALIIFIASIFTPILKIVVLSYLLLNLNPRSKPIKQSKLFFFIEFIGRWSMVDVFVVALTCALVKSQLAEVSPGSGIFAFALVVFFTMLATESFDIRLLWDNYRQNLYCSNPRDPHDAATPHPLH